MIDSIGITIILLAFSPLDKYSDTDKLLTQYFNDCSVSLNVEMRQLHLQSSLEINVRLLRPQLCHRIVFSLHLLLNCLCNFLLIHLFDHCNILQMPRTFFLSRISLGIFHLTYLLNCLLINESMIVPEYNLLRLPFFLV